MTKLGLAVCACVLAACGAANDGGPPGDPGSQWQVDTTAPVVTNFRVESETTTGMPPAEVLVAKADRIEDLESGFYAYGAFDTTGYDVTDVRAPSVTVNASSLILGEPYHAILSVVNGHHRVGHAFASHSVSRPAAPAPTGSLQTFNGANGQVLTVDTRIPGFAILEPSNMQGFAGVTTTEVEVRYVQPGGGPAFTGTGAFGADAGYAFGNPDTGADQPCTFTVRTRSPSFSQIEIAGAFTIQAIDRVPRVTLANEGGAAARYTFEVPVGGFPWLLSLNGGDTGSPWEVETAPLGQGMHSDTFSTAGMTQDTRYSAHLRPMRTNGQRPEYFGGFIAYSSDDRAWISLPDFGLHSLDVACDESYVARVRWTHADVLASVGGGAPTDLRVFAVDDPTQEVFCPLVRSSEIRLNLSPGPHTLAVSLVRRDTGGTVLAEEVQDNPGPLNQYRPDVTVFDVSPLAPGQPQTVPYLGGAVFSDAGGFYVQLEAHELDWTTLVNGKPPTEVILYMHGGGPVGDPDQWYGEWVPLLGSAHGAIYSSWVQGGFVSGQTRTFAVCMVNEDGNVAADFGPDQATVDLTFP